MGGRPPPVGALANRADRRWLRFITAASRQGLYTLVDPALRTFERDRTPAFMEGFRALTVSRSPAATLRQPTSLRRWLRHCHVVALGILLPGLPTPVSAQVPTAVPPGAISWEGGDPAVDPGTDFFRFANGGWIESHPIPDDRMGYSIATQLRMAAEDRVHTLLEEAASRRPMAGPDDDRTLVGTYYAACMDEQRADTLGASPLHRELAAIRQAHSLRDLARLMGRASASHQASVFALWVEADLGTPDRQRLHLGSAGLGTLDRDLYLSAESEAQREAYLDYVRRLLTLVHSAQPATEAREILSFETRIAAATPGAADQRELSSREVTLAVPQLQALAPGFPWTAYLAAAGARPGTPLAVIGPDALTGIAAEVSRTPLPVLRAWAAFHLADNSARLLSRPFRTAWFDFHGHVVQGLERPPPRWMWAVTQVAGGPSKGWQDSPGALDDAVGRLYVARWFDPAVRRPLLQLVQSLRSVMRERIGRSEWMSPVARQEALRKLDNYHIAIGAPAHSDQYPGLRIRRDDLYGDASRIMALAWARELQRLDHPSDREGWTMTPHTVNAYNYAPFGQIVFTAAVLQPPAYDPEQDLALIYGGIGAIIGHELTHAFDDVGRKFDADGQLRDWWLPEDHAAFQSRADRLIALYAACEAAPGAHVDGRLTLGENLADLGGLELAWMAYHVALHGEAPPVIDGLTGDQRFFLGFARLRRGHRRPQALLSDLRTDPHTPDGCRVNQVIRNLDGWYQAFHITDRQPLYLAPPQRTRIW